jgi:hypothetical protein
MHLFNTTPSSAKLTVRTHQWVLAACWAMLAYCRLAGVDLHGLTAGPGVAPVPATRSVRQRPVVRF